MVGLARAIYNPRLGEHTGALPDPAELCELPDEEAVRSHLFDAFIAAACTGPSAAGAGLRIRQRHGYFLARHLERMIDPDLGWWRLYRTVPLVVFGLAAILASGMAVALVFTLPGSSGPALAAGLAVGFAFGLANVLTVAYRRLPKHARRVAWRLGARGFISVLLLGLASIAFAERSDGGELTWGVLSLALAFTSVATAGVAVAFRNPAGTPAPFALAARHQLACPRIGPGTGGRSRRWSGDISRAGNRVLQPFGSALFTTVLPIGLMISGGVAGVLAAGAAVARQRALGSRGIRWPSRLGWLAPGLVLGLAPGFMPWLVQGIVPWLVPGVSLEIVAYSLLAAGTGTASYLWCRPAGWRRAEL